MAEPSILIVDDEPEICEMICDWLSDDGRWSVDYTTEPMRALEQLGDVGYDVMVTDMRMPGMDGLELARQARGVCPDVSVVAITGFASVPSSVAALRAGFVDYLQKPFRGDDIREAVFRAIARRQSAEVDEDLADEVTADNANLAAANEELRAQLDLASRELTLLQHRLATRVADLEACSRNADALEGQRDLTHLLSLGLVLLRESLPGDEHAMMIVRHKPDRTLAVAQLGEDEAVVNWIERPLSRGVVRSVVRRRQTALVEDAATSPAVEDLTPFIDCHGSVLVFPLQANDTVVGVAVVRRDQAAPAFTHSEVRHALHRAAEIGRALEVATAFYEQQGEMLATLRAMVRAVEDADEATRDHSERVTTLCLRTANVLGIQGRELLHLEQAARLHDIGKLHQAADAEPPSPEEHARRGYQLLRSLSFLAEAAELVRTHHLLAADDEASLERSVLACAEAFDEMTHGTSSVNPPMAVDEALAAIQNVGADPQVVHALARVVFSDV